MLNDFSEGMLGCCLVSSENVGQNVGVEVPLGAAHLTTRNMRPDSLLHGLVRPGCHVRLPVLHGC